MKSTRVVKKLKIFDLAHRRWEVSMVDHSVPCSFNIKAQHHNNLITRYF